MQFDLVRDVIDRAGTRPMPDIVVDGTGVRVPGQFTREGLEALSRCHVVYCVLAPRRGTRFLRGLGLPIEDLSHLYQPGRFRSEIYQQIVAVVLDRAARDRPLGYVTEGNPILSDRTTHGIVEGGPARGLIVRVYPGVSSIDTILVDLRHEIGSTGLQIYEASWFVARGIEPRTDVPCLLMQPGVFGTAYTVVGHQLMPGALGGLQEYLGRFYPPEHELLLVRSPSWWYEDERVHRVLLNDLGGVGERETEGTSLFIPRLREPAVADQAFVTRMLDRAHFAELYRPLT